MFNFETGAWMLGWQVSLYGLDNFLNVRSCVQINSRVRLLSFHLCLHAWTARLILILRRTTETLFSRTGFALSRIFNFYRLITALRIELLSQRGLSYLTHIISLVRSSK